MGSVAVQQGGEEGAWEARPGSALRGWLVLLPAAAFAFGYALWAVLVASLAPRAFRRRRQTMAHRWGNGLLALFGVRLEIHGEEWLRAPGPKVLIFNHQSILDMCLMAVLWTERSVILYKREFHSIPVIGRAMRALDLIPVERHEPEAAIRSLKAAAERLRQEDAQVFIAPEGTRSSTGRLGPFKLGPFRLARETGAPIVPLVFRGVWELMPHKRLIARPGRVRVDVLGPIQTQDWQEHSLREHADEIRRLYLDYLPGEGSRSGRRA